VEERPHPILYKTRTADHNDVPMVVIVVVVELYKLVCLRKKVNVHAADKFLPFGRG